MSVPEPLIPANEKVKTHLLIQDQAYQFLPNLAAIYGDTAAVILQQLYWRTHSLPWYEGEELKVQVFEGRTWIRIHNFMWYDTLEGICRHLSKSNFFKLRGEMSASSVIFLRDALGDDSEMSVNTNTKTEGPKWYAINTELIHQHELAYCEARDAALARRRAERAYIKSQNRDAHWRPRPGEDVSKKLNFWKILFEEYKSDDTAVNMDEGAGQDLSTSWTGSESTPEEGAGQAVSTSWTGSESTPETASPEIGPVLSNNGTSPFQEVENIESTNGTVSSPLPGTASLYAKKASSIEDKQQTAGKSPNGLAAAQSSIDNLPKTAPQPPSSQLAMPTEVAAPKNLDIPSGEPNAVLELVRNLLDVAETVLVDLSDQEAAAVVGTWPEATMSRAAVVEQMGRIGMSKKMASEMVKNDEMYCRWQLVCWERRPQRKHGYFESEGGKGKGSRIGAFRASITQEWEPWRQEDWLNDIRAAIVAEQKRLKFEEDKAVAVAYWATLEPRQKGRFDSEILIGRLRLNGLPDEGTLAFEKIRVTALLDPSVQAELENWKTPVGTPAAANGTSAVTSAKEPEVTLQPHEISRADLYAVKLRRRIQNGEISVDDLHRETKDLPVTKAMEAYIIDQVTQQLEARKAA